MVYWIISGFILIIGGKHYPSGHEIAPNTVANATKIIALATKIQKLVAKLATRTLWVLCILHLCFLQLNEALKQMNRRER